MPYDYSRQALYHPESRPVFAEVDRMPRFEADNFQFSLVNAWWLSNASHAAYYEAGRLEQELGRAGWRLIDFFAREGTQAFLAATEAFAILAFRGTEIGEPADLKVDADARLAPLQDGVKVFRGILGALEKVWPDVEHRLQEVAAQGLPIWYTGHSLGAALATIAAARRKPDALTVFAAPRVGNEAFVRLLDGLPVHRIVNCCDAVPTLPLRIMGYRHAGQLAFITATGDLLLNPPPWRILRSKVVGIGKYQATLPFFRRDRVKVRFLADHAIVNYTAALTEAMARTLEVA